MGSKLAVTFSPLSPNGLRSGKPQPLHLFVETPPQGIADVYNGHGLLDFLLVMLTRALCFAAHIPTLKSAAVLGTVFEK